MIEIYKNIDSKLQQIEALEQGTWVNIVDPTEEELNVLIDKYKLDASFVRSALDEEEASRIEKEDNQTLIVIDIPFAQKDNQAVIYSTIPLAIIVTEHQVLTVCTKDSAVLNDFSDNVIKNCNPAMKTRFILQLFFRVATKYLQYLKQIDKISNYVEKQLHKSMRNKELIQLLDLEKSLVFFSTSLKSNEVTMEKLLRGRFIKLYDEDQDLLEDVLIEVKQAIEMSNIYSSILSGTMDAFASVISNNLNIVMKVLTSLTILMAIPTMIFSFYGMNVDNLPYASLWWFPILVSVIATGGVTYLLSKRDMF